MELFTEALVRPDFDINLKDKDGNTILHQTLYMLIQKSFFREEYSLLRFMLESGADPNAKNRFGRTPLHNPFNLKINAIKLLAEYKADFGVTDKHGETPLHQLVFYKRSPNIIRIFLEQGGSTVNINQRNVVGKKALDIACLRGSINTVKLLLDYGADIDWLKAFKNYLVPIKEVENIAPYYRNLMFFIEHIDVNAVDSKGRSLLSFKDLTRGASKFVIQHIALVESLDNPINQFIYDKIHADVTFKEFFTKCQKELILAKKTYVIESSWITYFELLTGTKHQLKNYCGNSNLISDFVTNKLENFEKLFLIYRNTMREKVSVGKELRWLFVKAAEVLSRKIPIFDASSLIIHDTLDCILNNEDLSRLVYGHSNTYQ